MLTAWLRAQGRRVGQSDLNIDLCHELLRPERLTQRMQDLIEKPASLAIVHRVEMIRYVLARLENIRSAVFDKDPNGPEASQHDIRFCRQAVDLLLEGSLLARSMLSFEQISATVATYAAAPENDPAASILEAQLTTLLDRNRPRIFGISIAFWSQLLPALLLARWARARDPKVKIVLGGQQVMLWRDALSKVAAPWVDGLCIGGGEACLDALCDAVNGKIPLSHVPNMVWLDKPNDPPALRCELLLDDLPPPDFDGLPIRGYMSEEVHLAMITCVGCYWGKCSFCSYGNRNRSGHGYQQMSPDRIAASCEALTDKYGVGRINFVDENTPVPNVVRAMRLLNARGKSIRFSTRNRLDPFLLNASFCSELAQRGCVLMSVGYETNSQRLLDRLNKGVRAENYGRIIDNLHQAGISLRLSVMGGILDETEAERAESERFLREYAGKIGIDIMQMLVMEPDTDLWRDPAKFGLQVDNEAKLRGNTVLNFGMGRMGASFEWLDGDQFDDRLNRFVSIFNNVNPQKNDELAPERRKVAATPARNTERTVLLPWVRHIRFERAGGERDSVLIDLLWQRFYRVPSSWDFPSGGIPDPSDPLSRAEEMQQLIEIGLAAPVSQAG